MRRDSNVIGQIVSRLRYERHWSQDDLVARLQILGCSITRNILANIETRRSVATDKQILYFAQVFGVDAAKILPPLPTRSKGTPLGINTQAATRRRRE